MSDTPPPQSPGSHGDPSPTTQVNPAPPLARLQALLAGIGVVGGAGAVCYGIIWVIMSGAPSGDEMSFADFLAVMGRGLGATLVCAIPVSILVRWTNNRWSRSTTPGMDLVGLRVVDVRTGDRVSWGKMLVREIVGKYAVGACLVVLLGNLTDKDPPAAPILFVLVYAAAGLYVLAAAVLVLRTPTRQTPWDYLAKTTVVKVP